MASEVSTYKVVSFSGTDPALKEFDSMIRKDFKTALRYGNGWYKLIDQDRYYQIYEAIISALLKRPDSVVRVAVASEDPSLAYGWSIVEDEKVHFVFVKKDVRNEGIGTSLLPKEISVITHLTTSGEAIWQKKYPDAIFDPFA